MAIFKRGQTYYIEYRVDGEKRRKAIGPSKKLAETVLSKYKVQVVENRHLDKARSDVITFEQLSDDYMIWANANKLSADRDQRSIVVLSRWFEGKKLTQIRPLQIERFKGQRRKEVGPATVNRELACLKGMFSKAIQWELTEDNPVKRVKMFKEPPGRVRYLSKEEMNQLLAELAEHLKPIVMIALLTGMRKTEILNLTWNDIDFDLLLIHVLHSKNGESRRIAMSRDAEAVLRALPKRHDQIFTRRDGSPIRNLKTGFEAAVKRAEINDFSFHDLRHTFASYMVMSGAELLTVKEILGHKTMAMTLRYAHLSPSYQRAAMERLEIISAPILPPGGKSKLAIGPLTRYPASHAGVVELVDTRDLKSLAP